MVKFVSPLEFYDWYDTNREEIKDFKEQYDASIPYWYKELSARDRKIRYTIGSESLKDYFKKFHFGWTKIKSGFERGGIPANSNDRSPLFEEDEIYIVTNRDGWSRRNRWWIIYIPIPHYQQRPHLATKECWWLSKAEGGRPLLDVKVTSHFAWIEGFILYDELSISSKTLNYPGGL